MNGSNAGRICRGVRLDRLVKHLFISGVPGSGKTIATFHLLLQLRQLDWHLFPLPLGKILHPLLFLRVLEFYLI